MKNILKISFAYLAAIIGAGFASGSEIIHYFVKFGNISLIGIVLSAAGFGFFAFLTLYLCKQYEKSSFDGIIQAILPPILQKYIKAVISFFMLIILGGMISAFSMLSQNVFGLSPSIAGIIFSCLCGVILLFPDKSIINQTSVIGGFIVIFICIICVYLINNRCVNVFSQKLHMSTSAVSYTSYNFISVCPFLCNASLMLKNKKQCYLTGIASAVMSLFCLGLLWCIISVYYGKIHLGELPMLTIVSRQGNYLKLIYSLVIGAAIFTSAIANGFGIVQRMNSLKLSLSLKVIIVMTLGYFISSIGFSNIVSKLYNIAGFASIILPIILFINFSKKVDIKRKREINRDI